MGSAAPSRQHHPKALQSVSSEIKLPKHEALSSSPFCWQCGLMPVPALPAGTHGDSTPLQEHLRLCLTARLPALVADINSSHKQSKGVCGCCACRHAMLQGCARYWRTGLSTSLSRRTITSCVRGNWHRNTAEPCSSTCRGEEERLRVTLRTYV